MTRSQTIGLSLFVLVLAGLIATPCRAQSESGPIVITEVLYNGASLPGISELEWIEVYNASDTPVDLNGWSLRTLISGGSLRHTIGSSVVLAPWSFGLLCGSSTSVLACDYRYRSISLRDVTGTIRLLDAQLSVADEVTYGAAGWPAPAEGQPIVFTGRVSEDNDDGAAWQISTEQLGYFERSSNRGTPGIHGPDQYLPVATPLTGVAGWRMLAAPFPDLTVRDLSERVHVQGLPERLPRGTPNVYLSYSSPGQDSSFVYWTPASSLTNPLRPGAGYLLYVFPSDLGKSFTYEGMGRSLNVTVYSLPRSRRWHFIGNPFPNAFDIGGLNLGSQGFQTTVQAWVPNDGVRQQSNGTVVAGSYRILNPVPGCEQDLSDDLMPHQGFFAENDPSSGLSTGMTSLTFSYQAQMPLTAVAARSGSPSQTSADPKINVPPMWTSPCPEASEPPKLPFLFSATASDGTVVAQDAAAILTFSPDASDGWDAGDATKLAPMNGSQTTLGFAAVDDRSEQRAVASYSSTAGPVLVDLVLVPGAVDPSTTLTLSWNASAIPADWTAELLVGDVIVDLHEQSSYPLPSSLVASLARSLHPTPESVSESVSTAASSVVGRRPTRPVARALPMPMRKSPTTLAVRVGPSASLPVELASFSATASGRAALLSWTTLSESNNAGFHVERNTPTGFVEVAYRAGTGTSNEPRSYRVHVRDLPVGTHTFRLRQVDTDGTSHVAGTETVRIDPSDRLAVSVSPNPVRDAASIRVTVDREQRVRVVLFDVMGRAIRTLHDGSVGASAPLHLRLTNPPPSGLYLIRVVGESVVHTQKMHVVR